jgi:hypothetical protein
VSGVGATYTLPAYRECKMRGSELVLPVTAMYKGRKMTTNKCVTIRTGQSSRTFRTSPNLDMVGSSQCLYKRSTVPHWGGGGGRENASLVV